VCVCVCVCVGVWVWYGGHVLLHEQHVVEVYLRHCQSCISVSVLVASQRTSISTFLLSGLFECALTIFLTVPRGYRVGTMICSVVSSNLGDRLVCEI
jgi:hypothetical protein